MRPHFTNESGFRRSERPSNASALNPRFEAANSFSERNIPRTYRTNSDERASTKVRITLVPPTIVRFNDRTILDERNQRSPFDDFLVGSRWAVNRIARTEIHVDDAVAQNPVGKSLQKLRHRQWIMFRMVRIVPDGASPDLSRLLQIGNELGFLFRQLSEGDARAHDRPFASPVRCGLNPSDSFRSPAPAGSRPARSIAARRDSRARSCRTRPPSSPPRGRRSTRRS